MPRAQPGQRFGGRQKGTPNKITALLKDDILEAAEQAHPQGRIGYLKWLAKEHAVAFAGLLGKVLPLTVAGDPNAPVVQRIEVIGGLPDLPMDFDGPDSASDTSSGSG